MVAAATVVASGAAGAGIASTRPSAGLPGLPLLPGLARVGAAAAVAGDADVDVIELHAAIGERAAQVGRGRLQETARVAVVRDQGRLCDAVADLEPHDDLAERVRIELHPHPCAVAGLRDAEAGGQAVRQPLEPLAVGRRRARSGRERRWWPWSDRGPAPP